MSTVAKINMCKSGYKTPLSLCGANEIASQINCTHYWPHSTAKHCMFFREETAGACDNVWAQRKVEMPKEVLELLKSKLSPA